MSVAGAAATDLADIYDGVSKGEAALLAKLARDLNAKVEQAADDYGWRYVRTSDAFRGHGYCTGASHRYLRHGEESCVMQGDVEGVMHPNAAGHQVALDQLLAALSDWRRTHTLTGSVAAPPR